MVTVMKTVVLRTEAGVDVDNEKADDKSKGKRADKKECGLLLFCLMDA